MITFSLDSDSKEPMYIQIYEYIKSEILAGRLSAHEKLPSSRSLAAYLQVSRSTIDTAYEQLVAEGYLDAREKRGYFVNSITHNQSFPVHSTVSPSQTKESIPAKKYQYDFNPDAIDTTHFPYSIWKSIGKNQLDNPENFVSGNHFGSLPLRQAIADYLHGSRGVNCSVENIIVGAGLDHLLQMLSVLFERKYTIAMEDPGYQSARNVLLSTGYSVIDIPLKNDVFHIEHLNSTDADICYVTPTHQFPLGTIMSISGRQQLLSWANEKETRFIIEDDHDSEFRYKGKPIPALQSLDKQNKVIYIGTFSKAVSPAIRMGYMVLPPSLLETYRKLCGAYSCPVSCTNQAIMTEFIRDGYFEKHLNRMRKIYKTKHDIMMNAIETNFSPEKIEISGDNAGLYIILRYRGLLSEEEIEKRAEKNSIRLRSLRPYYATLPAEYFPTFLLGFANLSEQQIRDGIMILAQQVFS